MTTFRRYLAGLALVVAANTPLLLLALPLSSHVSIGTGDARTHAVVVRALAVSGAPHAWTDTLLGGFPLGPHYPMLAWTVSALLVKLGLDAQGAVNLLAFLALLATPLLVFVLALRRGARLLSALIPALFLSWLAPSNWFTGGYEVFYGQGLLSQVVAIPLAVVLFDAVAYGRRPWSVTVPAVLLATCHPQILVGAIAVMLLPALTSGDRPVLTNFARACGAGGVAAFALYAPGIRTLRIPFGWPPMDAWKVTGFGPDHVSRWFVDGELFDARRPSVLTAVWLVALVTCVASAWRGQNARAARAVLLASAASVALSVSGGLLHDLGRPGAFVLSFLQPLRVLCLVPVVAAALIAAALEVLGDALAKLPEGYGTRRLVVAILWLRRTGLAPLVLAVPVVALACVALPDRLRWVHEWRQSLAAVEASSRACAALDYVPAPGAGPWWRRLEGGRLWHDAESTNGLTCAVGAGFEVASTVPLAATSAVGTHVGVHAVAFRQLHPERPGSALRAEALGIRHALVDDQSASRDDGWEVVARSAPYALLARRGGTGLVGVGCVESALYGADAEVRDLLFATLPTAQGAAHFLDPTHLVALRADAGPTREEPVELDGCDATSAKVTESPAEPGRFDAQVESASPVDVVLRATAFPSWGVRVDGQPASIRTLAVGFFSVRVAAGAHHVEATVAPLPDYGVGLVIALLGTVALSTPWSLRRRLPHA